MTESDFIEELVDVLELEDEEATLKTRVDLDSLKMMSVIAFLDENFSRTATAEDLKEVASLQDIWLLAGKGDIE